MKGRDSTGFDRFQELFDVLPCGIRYPRSAHHSNKFFNAVVARQWLDAGHRSSFGNQFLNSILMIGECSDLRQMRNAEDLIS